MKRFQLIEDVKRGEVEAFRELLDLGVDVNFVIIDGFSGYVPLHIAAKYGHKEIVSLLLERGASVNEKVKGLSSSECSFDSLYLASKNGFSEVVTLLLKAGANVNSVRGSLFRNEDFPLHIAAENGHIEVVEILLEAGADINKRHFDSGVLRVYDPLYRAARAGHVEMVNYLLKKGADIMLSHQGRSALFEAVAGGHLGVVKVFLEAGVDVNYNSSRTTEKINLLSVAVGRNKREIVIELLSWGANPNFIDRFFGRLPLHIAAEECYVDIIQDLLDRGADCSLVDVSGETALEKAMVLGRKYPEEEEVAEAIDLLTNWTEWHNRWVGVRGDGIRASWCSAVARAGIRRGETSLPAACAGGSVVAQHIPLLLTSGPAEEESLAGEVGVAGAGAPLTEEQRVATLLLVK